MLSLSPPTTQLSLSSLYYTYQLKMKKKIVVQFAVNDEKSRTKALKISVGISGVESAALTGKDMDMVVVVGENIAVALTRQLRKSLGFTDLLSVGEDKKENKLAATPPSQQTVAWPYLAPQWTGYPVYHEPVVAPQESNCTIM